MANREKGEVDLSLAGQTWTFKLGTGALIELQELVSKAEGSLVPIERIFQDAARGRVSSIRAILWAGLRKYHGDRTLTDVEDLLDAASPAEIQALLGDLGATTQPDQADLDTLGVAEVPGKGHPRKARAVASGTGEGFTSTPASVA